MEEKRTFTGWIKFLQENVTVPIATEEHTKHKVLIAGFEGNKANFAKEVIWDLLGEDVAIHTLSYTDAKKELTGKVISGSYHIVLVGCIPHKIHGVDKLKDLEEFANIVLCVDGNENLSNNKSAVRRALEGHIKNVGNTAPV